MNRPAAARPTEELLAAARANTLRPNAQRPSGKAGDIAAELEHRLVTGHYAFGESLSINQLSQEFGASRQPISAALNHLRSLGYLNIVPQVGCAVVAPDAEEIDDYFYLVGKTESAMAGLAANRHEDVEATELVALAKHILHTTYGDDAERKELAVGIEAFHRQIRSMARSPALESRSETLWRISAFYLWQGPLNFSAEQINLGSEERQSVAKLIASRDMASAETMMEKHMRGKPQRAGII